MELPALDEGAPGTIRLTATCTPGSTSGLLTSRRPAARPAPARSSGRASRAAISLALRGRRGRSGWRTCWRNASTWPVLSPQLSAVMGEPQSRWV